MIVPGRYNGPEESGNGGYTCGLVAALLGGVAEVTLRLPPPLDREFAVVRDDGRLEIRDGCDRLDPLIDSVVLESSGGHGGSLTLAGFTRRPDSYWPPLRNS